MNDLFDYLDWRGDVPFAVAPFNEVDSLLLCELSYNELAGVVPPPGEGFIPLPEAAARYFAGRSEEEIHVGAVVPHDVVTLFRVMAESPRYREIVLGGYVSETDEGRETQFAALTAALPDGTAYIAFRGTDDTLVGWKENFNMSFCDEVPAQRSAAAYLETAAALLPAPLRVGGHSKGGNLAVYAAMRAAPKTQGRLLAVYNFDGPGFGRAVLSEPGYRRIRPRLRTILPQSSVVGMLLEHEDTYEVVKSGALGLLQHDGFTWGVRPAGFDRLEDVDERDKYLDRTLRNWIGGLTPERRRAFTEALFDILESTGARDLTDLSENRFRAAAAMLETMRQLPPEDREVLSDTLHLLLRESFAASRERLSDTLKKRRS